MQTPSDGEFTYHRHTTTMRNGSSPTQRAILDTEAAGHSFKSFAPALIPGLYQTRAYAVTRLTEAHAQLGLPDDVEATVNLRMARTTVLDDTSRSFHAVIAENVLFGASADLEVMVEQLEWLTVLAGRPHIRIGILPTTRRAPTAMAHFDIVDDRSVSVETLAVSYTFSSGPEVAMHVDLYSALSQLAMYDEAAMSLIRRAAESL